MHTSSLRLRAEYDRASLDKFERLDHLLGSGLVFREMCGFWMRFVRIRIPINLENPNVDRIIFFSHGAPRTSNEGHAHEWEGRAILFRSCLA